MTKKSSTADAPGASLVVVVPTKPTLYCRALTVKLQVLVSRKLLLPATGVGPRSVTVTQEVATFPPPPPPPEEPPPDDELPPPPQAERISPSDAILKSRSVLVEVRCDFIVVESIGYC